MTLLNKIAVGLAAALLAHASHAQVTFRSAAQAGQAAGSATTITHVGAGAAATNDGGCPRSVTPAIPGGANGDLLIALVNSREDASAIAASGTWTQLYGASYGGGGQDLEAYIYYRFATGADAFTFTQSGTCNSLAARVSRFRGVNPAAPFYNVPIPGGNVVQQNANNVDTGTETTTDADAMLLVASFVNDNAFVCEGGGWNTSFESPLNLGRDLSFNLHYQLQTTAGAKSIANWPIDTNSNACPSPNNDENFGIIFALRPQPSGLTINVPAGTTTSDVMVASIAVRDSPITLAAPAGWTLVREDVQGGGGGATSRMATWTRVVAGAEPGSYTWSFGGGTHTGAAGIISTFSGVDTANPIDTHNGAATGSGADHTAPGVTTTLADAMLVGSFEYGSATSNWTATPMTEILEASSLTPSDDLGVSMVMAWQTQAAAGASGTRTATADTAGANADQGVAQLVALRSGNLPPVLYLRMDETGWNGTAGEVLDASGNGLHGVAPSGATTANATPAIPGNPGSCRYGTFDGTDDYVEVADNALLDIQDELTVLVWVRPTAYPGGGGLKTIISKDENYEFHLTNTGQIDWWWGGGAQELVSSGTLPLNTWTHVAIVYSRAGGFQRIYLNGAQDPSTNNQTGALTLNADPFQVGSDQGFAGRQFAGLIDEVVVFRQALSQTRVQQTMNATRPCASTLDHFAISHSGSGVACDTHDITITAHDSSHAAIDAGSLLVNLSTSNGKGTWTGIAAGGGALNDAAPGDGAATYQFASGSNSVTLSFRYADLAGATETFSFNVAGAGFTETTGTASGTDDPAFTLAQAGFRFRNITDGNAAIPVQISGKPSDTGFNAKAIRIQAIRTDTSTGSCVGLFASQPRTVELGAECNSPGTCAARQVSVNASNIATSNDNGGAGAAAYTGVSLAFNASSEADAVIAYPDAGQVSLHARYDLDPLVAGFEATGSSNAFVVRPFGFAFPAINHSSTAAGTLIGAAGDNFAMTVQAYQWAAGEDANDDGVPDAGVNLTDNGTLPNFAASATLGVSANLPGVATGAVARGAGCASPASVAMAGGTGAAADWCYSEAGNVLFTASVANYLAAGVNISGNSGLDGDPAGGYVGRFKPKHFVVTGAPTLANRAALACASSFTYLNEGLRLGFTLEARNAQNVLTQNYTGAYARLNLASAASLGIGARSGATDLTSRVDNALAPGGSFSNGTANLTATTGIGRASPDNPDGPFTGTQFGIAPNDADGVQMQSFDLDVDNDATDEHFAIAPVTELRYGRLDLDNNYGPVNQPVPIPIAVQHWNGSAFVTNALDSCTTLARANIALAFTGAVNPCETAVTQASIAFASGAATLTLAAPGPGNRGTVRLTPQLGSAAGNYCPAVGAGALATIASPAVYLLGRWNDAADPDSNPATTYDDEPPGQAGFGLYGSRPKSFIFFRENY